MNTETENKPLPKKRHWLIWLLVVGAILAVIGLTTILAAEKYTSRAEFCGLTCHIMKPNWETYKNDKHFKKNVLCIDCHYAPGEKITPKAKFRGLGQLFSYLGFGDKEVRKRPEVSDLSCSTSNCHPKEKFYDKKIDYKKTYQLKYKGDLKPFVHKTHFEKLIDGQKMHCSTCHMHSARDKHLDVPMAICFICHLRNAPENQGRAKCSVCHTVPTKVLKAKTADPASSNEPKKPITHETLEKQKVSCSSCHMEMIRVPLKIKADYCLECHHDASPEMLAKGANKKLMHEEHVAKQKARCTQCHETIVHKKINYLDAAIENCSICHAKPHLYTKKLLTSEEIPGVKEKFPSQMHEFGVNCLGCHKKDGRDEKGNQVKVGSDKACVNCHNGVAKYGTMTKQWKDDVKEALAEVKKSEQKTIEAITEAKGKVPAKAYNAALAKLNAGQESLRTAAAGGGAHNKKLAMWMIDMAQQSFDEAQAALKGAPTPKGGK
jgi:hypothetical protein